ERDQQDQRYGRDQLHRCLTGLAACADQEVEPAAAASRAASATGDEDRPLRHQPTVPPGGLRLKTAALQLRDAIVKSPRRAAIGDYAQRVLRTFACALAILGPAVAPLAYATTAEPKPS